MQLLTSSGGGLDLQLTMCQLTPWFQRECVLWAALDACLLHRLGKYNEWLKCFLIFKLMLITNTACFFMFLQSLTPSSWVLWQEEKFYLGRLTAWKAGSGHSLRSLSVLIMYALDFLWVYPIPKLATLNFPLVRVMCLSIYICWPCDRLLSCPWWTPLFPSVCRNRLQPLITLNKANCFIQGMNWKDWENNMYVNLYFPKKRAVELSRLQKTQWRTYSKQRTFHLTD